MLRHLRKDWVGIHHIYMLAVILSLKHLKRSLILTAMILFQVKIQWVELIVYKSLMTTYMWELKPKMGLKFGVLQIKIQKRMIGY